MAVREYTITSVHDLLEFFASDDAHPLNHCYRGVDGASFPLVPGAFRPPYWLDNEASMLTFFRAAAPSRTAFVPEERAYADWMALAQHWGLPTRLLDWSMSPLVACQFATARHSAEDPPDAAVWILDPIDMNAAFGNEPFHYPIRSDRARLYIRPAFYGTFDPDMGDRALAVLASEIDGRMHAQQGCFTIHTTPMPLEDTPGAETWLQKVVIPASSLELVRTEIRQLGVHHASLFPDLGALATHIAANHLEEI